MQVRVERQSQTILDEPTADLLMELERSSSISAAARTLEISYRHAWLLIQAANESAGVSLVETAVGGKRGGGAQLTERGRAALDAFRQVQELVRTAAAKALPKIVAHGASDRLIVRLGAAISLQEVVAKLLNEYALIRPAVSVRTFYAASNELADQILSGTAADVFVSASGGEIDRLAKAGLVARQSRRRLASNGLAIVGAPKLAGKLRKPADLGRLDDLTLVIADPACPLGKCTAEFLRREQLADRFQERIRVVDNSRAVVGSMGSNDNWLGIVFGSDVANAAGVANLLQVPMTKVKATYEGVVVARSNSQEEAKSLLTFFTSKDARNYFRRCGFSP